MNDRLSTTDNFEQGPGRRVSFDHNEHTNYNIEYNDSSDSSNKLSETSISKSHKSKHGFYSEFEIVPPVAITSTYSLRSLRQRPSNSKLNKDKCKISKCLPILQWLPHYKLCWLKPDLLAALTVSILQVPQVLAYAVLAGLPPEWGLYASIVPVILYSLFSTSTKVAVGPGAPSAIMLASAVSAIVEEYGLMSEDDGYDELYQKVAMTFTFCCGTIFIVLGFMRAGFVVVFLSRPVMTGFIMSAALIIMLSQCRSLFGLDIGRYPIFYENLIAVIANIHTINWYTTAISAGSLILLFIPKWFSSIPRWVPMPLIVMAINILLSYFFNFSSLGVETIGAEIKSGFPMPKIPNFSYYIDVFPAALIVTVVDYMSNIMLAQAFEQKTKDLYRQQLNEYDHYIKKMNDDDDEICDDDDDELMMSEQKEVQKPMDMAPIDVNANMEFMAYGVANLFGSWFSSQLISASFSRTALNYEMNGQTRIASFFRVIICVLCALFLMPLLSPLPKCVLAAVVCTAVYRLVKSGVHELIFLWRVSKLELIEFMTVLIAPLIIGMEMGVFLAIGASVIVNLLRHTFASVVFLGQLRTKHGDDAVEYVDVEKFKHAKAVPNVVIIELKSELSFANNLRLVRKIRQLLAEGNRFIVVSLNLTSFIDSTAIREIVSLFGDAKGSYICLSQCRPKVVDLIRRYQRSAEKFPENVKTFVSTHDAVAYLNKVRKAEPDYDDLSDTDESYLKEETKDVNGEFVTKDDDSPTPPAPNMRLATDTFVSV